MSYKRIKTISRSCFALDVWAVEVEAELDLLFCQSQRNSRLYDIQDVSYQSCCHFSPTYSSLLLIVGSSTKAISPF